MLLYSFASEKYQMVLLTKTVVHKVYDNLINTRSGFHFCV